VKLTSGEVKNILLKEIKEWMNGGAKLSGIKVNFILAKLFKPKP
jgi:hypothetical protein